MRVCVCFFLNFIVRIRTKRERETRRREPFEQHAVLNTVLSGRAPGAGKGSRPTRRPCPRSARQRRVDVRVRGAAGPRRRAEAMAACSGILETVPFRVVSRAGGRGAREGM